MSCQGLKTWFTLAIRMKNQDERDSKMIADASKVRYQTQEEAESVRISYWHWAYEAEREKDIIEIEVLAWHDGTKEIAN